MTKSTNRRKHYPRSWTLRQRFEANVPDRPQGECWLWAGSRQKSGYGQISEGSRDAHKVHLAHRLAYQFWIGPIPEGLEVEHICEVKACVNPEHLAAVTHRKNMARSAHRIGWKEYWRRKREEA